MKLHYRIYSTNENNLSVANIFCSEMIELPKISTWQIHLDKRYIGSVWGKISLCTDSYQDAMLKYCYPVIPTEGAKR